MLLSVLSFAFYLYCCWCQVLYYEYDVEGEAQHGFYVTITIGRPPQNIKLLIDTGSANFAVAVTPPLKSGSNNFFRYSNSNTFVKTSSHIAIQYVQGNWSGFLATDIVYVEKNRYVRCAIACMSDVHNVFDINSMFSGILGLAYPAVAKPNSSISPFFDAIRKAQNINDVFSISLCGPSFSDSRGSDGKLHFGFISARYYSGKIMYSPITRERLYEITLTTLRVGSKEIAVNCEELNDPRSSVDTGTTQLLVSSLVYNEIISKIKLHVSEEESQSGVVGNVSKFWLNDTAACVPKMYFNISLFPDLFISFYHTDNSYFNLVISPELYLLPFQEFSIENTCFTLGIGVSDVGTIVGSTLLKGYYVVFDRANKRIGFANSSFCLKEMSFVTMPSFLDSANFSNCKCVENNVQNDSITAGTIILLVFILILAVLLLYRIIVWVQAIRFQYSNNHLDTSNLVEEDDKL
ncbi:beta-secretase 1 [Parasteatoda tepidariorum]|uniref:beta-secretase 1 n=1 Tax=Parasteatoda tepidariorum TaxID=114398 RepID=UPI00077FD49E|nr:beta-secretase 1 [Parasteatoda tepidariorum]